jgi:hypothetical protein
MKEHIKGYCHTVNWLQFFIGAAWLLLGTFVYIIDRPPEQTYFVCYSVIDISLYNILPNLFGPIGNNLPAFIHVFAFTLITASLISCRKIDNLVVCLSWFVVDIGFELGQKYKSLAVKLIPGWFSQIPFLENTRNFFLRGTFDCVDIGFICLGTIMAYYVLSFTNTSKEKVQP